MATASKANESIETIIIDSRTPSPKLTDDDGNDDQPCDNYDLGFPTQPLDGDFEGILSKYYFYTMRMQQKIEKRKKNLDGNKIKKEKEEENIDDDDDDDIKKTHPTVR